MHGHMHVKGVLIIRARLLGDFKIWLIFTRYLVTLNQLQIIRIIQNGQIASNHVQIRKSNRKDHKAYLFIEPATLILHLLRPSYELRTTGTQPIT